MKNKYNKKRGMKDISHVLDNYTKPFFKRRGFAENKIITDWEKIVGSTLAKYSTPRKLTFNRDKRADGTLHIEVYDSGMAMQMTYIEPVVIEKIATYFGYRSVVKIKIIQKPSPMMEEDIFEYKAPKISAEKQTAMEALLDGVEDEDMRKVLLSLGSNISDKS